MAKIPSRFLGDAKSPQHKMAKFAVHRRWSDLDSTDEARHMARDHPNSLYKCVARRERWKILTTPRKPTQTRREVVGGGGVDFFGVDPLDREFTRVTRLKGRRIKNKIKIK